MRVARLAALALAAGCASATGPTAVVGQWGGAQASLVLTRAGGTISYLCGSGTIDSTWTLTADGLFAATGEHFFGGGPVPAGGSTPHPATYAGQVDGDHLTLTVTVTDLKTTLGPFVLVRGGPLVHQLCV